MLSQLIRLLWRRGCTAGLSALLVASSAAGAPSAKLDFNFSVRPLLSDRCYTCHGPDEKARKAKLRLDTVEGLRGKTRDGVPIVVPGSHAASDLWRRLVTTNADDLMPPAESHLKLSSVEIETLAAWIDQGAVFRPHWSFNPVEPVGVPVVASSEFTRNEIDRFVQAALDSHGLHPSPETTREQWLRRASLDVTGLPPTLEELDRFLADATPEAYSRVVDRLLASPAYGERMASEWMDLARYADTYGYQADVDRDMSPWRDWVIRSFNENLPYDQFVLWQLAGDLLPGATRDQVLATAFNRLHRQTNEGGSIEEEFRTEYVSDRIHTMGTTFMALAFECGRCHDHKYDPISQRDYYGLASFFNNIDESGLYPHFTRATPTPTLFLYDTPQEQAHAEALVAVAAAEQGVAAVTAAAKDRFAAWRASKDAHSIGRPRPVAAFSFDEIVTNQFPNRVDVQHPASLSESPEVVEGHAGHAVRFSGDNAVVCKGVGHFRRTDPFSISFWIQPTEAQSRGVILHHSRAWTDSGSRGYELVMEGGRLQFALIHFWPGNAIAIRSRGSLPLGRWSQVTLTYDGSSRAAGMTLFLDGEPMPTEVVRDHLYKDILHRGEWGDGEVGGIDLTLGGRFRDSGFKNGSLDELEVFDVCLTPGEVKRGASEAALPGWEEYLARVDPPCREALALLKKARDREDDAITRVREIMVMREREGRRPTFILKRGSYSMPTDPVEPGVPERIFPFAPGLPRNRLGLARWLTDPRHPLTARVAVNRIWKGHFGRGLVATSDDFGAQGQLPSHPELLDWLARRFIDSGWDGKGLHRLILLSGTYRQSSDTSPALLAADPDNRWLARGPRHRLQAEQIRDQALAASGLLVTTLGGPSVRPYQPAGVWEDAGTGKSYTQDKGPGLYRRSLYTFWRRTAPPPSMLSFDATSREVCTAKRETTTTPLQALVLLNDLQFVEASRVLAERVIREHPQDIPARIVQLFRTLTSRRPDSREQELLSRLYDEQASLYKSRPAAAERLASAGEWPRDGKLDAVDVAATTLVVSTMMNHDEFVMKR